MAKFTRRRIGEILVENNVVTEKQIVEALEAQKTDLRPIGQILISKGLVTEEKLLQALSDQLNIPQVNLYNYHLDPEVATSIPSQMAQLHQIIPIQRNEKKVVLAMANPMNILAQDDAARYLQAEIEPVLALPSAIEHVINQLFGLKESIELTDEEKKSRENEEEILRLKALVEDAPIVKVVNSLIHQAVTEGASDIHIEPSGAGVRIRMRIDGILHDLMSPPKDTQPLIVSRIKIMSNLDIAERRLPQDGRILLQSSLKDVNLRVSTMPTIHGEKVVIRILNKDRVVLPLEELGLSKPNFRVFKQSLLNRSGMILVTGPTGCGKTTTLYSVLNYLNRPEDNIITVEDPVEYRLEGINQVQINPRINLTFANTLRAILRQDPNIVMIGEIRDLETAEIATRAALTGHLVLSTLHTNDAPRAISRLLDMGVENYLITSSLMAVVAQRLIRLICPECRQQYMPTPEQRVLFRQVFGKEAPGELYRGDGCKSCNQTGYRGRVAIHEVLKVDQEIRSLILESAGPERILEAALQQGMITMLHDGLRRIEKGHTTLDEVVRVAFDSATAESALIDLKNIRAAV